ncbi:MAG: histidine phosphatase family protein [Chloroflexi bacterium]|nr:histidine phosphatase family protein [Chloroflexota bacterium]
MRAWAEGAGRRATWPTTCLRLLLIRHGETLWNREGRYQGRTDVPLSTEGKAQAMALAEVLRAEPIAAVYTSPLRRAYDTAACIAAVHGLHPWSDPRLMEIHQGEWEGLRPVEIERAWPELYRRWLTEPETVRLPGGETLGEVQARVLAAVTDIAARWAGRTICIVAHKVSLAVIRAAARGLPLRDVLAYMPPNASVEAVTWPADCTLGARPEEGPAR